MIFTAKTRPTRASRHGVSMIAALALTVVAAAFTASWTASLLSQSRQTDLFAQRQQARVLAESALRRAVARSTIELNYDGERWRVTPERLGQAYGAVVDLRILRVDGRPDRVSARVYLPGEENPSVTHTAALELRGPTKGDLRE